MSIKVQPVLNYFSRSKQHLRTSVKRTSNPQKTLKSLEKLNSEKGSIIITAIGTGLIAPLMIAFNPFTKEDKNTKKYSALRQPISAVLSLMAQLGINKQAVKVIESQSGKGKLGHYYDTGLYMSKEEAISSIKKDIVEKLKSKGKSQEEALKIAAQKIKNLPEEAINKRISKSFTPREETLKNIVKQEKTKDYKKFVEEFLQNPKARFEEFAKKSGTKKTFESFADEFFETPIKKVKERLLKETPELKNSPEQLQNLARNKVLEHIEKFKKEAATFAQKAKKWGIKHKGEIITKERSLRKSLEMVPKYTKEFKNRAGFILAVFTIPITCWTLNYIYPKIMNFAFPKIAQGAKGKEIDDE